MSSELLSALLKNAKDDKETLFPIIDQFSIEIDFTQRAISTLERRLETTIEEQQREFLRRDILRVRDTELLLSSNLRTIENILHDLDKLMEDLNVAQGDYSSLSNEYEKNKKPETFIKRAEIETALLEIAISALKRMVAGFDFIIQNNQKLISISPEKLATLFLDEVEKFKEYKINTNQRIEETNDALVKNRKALDNFKKTLEDKPLPKKPAKRSREEEKGKPRKTQRTGTEESPMEDFMGSRAGESAAIRKRQEQPPPIQPTPPGPPTAVTPAIYVPSDEEQFEGEHTQAPLSARDDLFQKPTDAAQSLFQLQDPCFENLKKVLFQGMIRF